MNPRVKKLWITELRSGKHPQGKGRLSSSEGLCCLGILCTIHARETGTKWDHHPLTDTTWVNTYLHEGGVLPKVVAEWAGLDDVNPYIQALDMRLSAINDRGDSFEEIADLIEAEL